MKGRKKANEMKMLRLAGLSLASADRMAGSTAGAPVLVYGLSAAAIVAMSAVGVWALNLPAAPTPPIVASLPEVAASPTPDLVEPAVVSASEPTFLAFSGDADVALGDVPLVTGLEDAPPVVETPSTPSTEVVDCVTTLTRDFAGVVFHFEAGSAALKPQDFDLLLSLGERAVSCSQARILVAGHSDSSGDEALNLKLSWERADQTVETLQTLGIDVAQFDTMGFGARAPLTQGSSAEEEINRRVEFRVTRVGDQL
ncbi:MAG: OmpA family protein [Pseudomonadota bacterium]